MKAKIGDVYTIYNNRLRLYTACQITNVIEDKGDAICLYLDWTGESPLHLVQMENLQPLYMDFMYWERQLCIANVDIDVPAYFIFVGNIPPLTNEENSYFGTGNYGYDVYRQIKWQQIPEERRKAFKIAMKSEETVSLRRFGSSIPFSYLLKRESGLWFAPLSLRAARGALVRRSVQKSTKCGTHRFDHLCAPLFVLQRERQNVGRAVS